MKSQISNSKTSKGKTLQEVVEAKMIRTKTILDKMKKNNQESLTV